MPLAIIWTNLNLAAQVTEFMDLIIEKNLSIGEPPDDRNKLDTSAAMTFQHWRQSFHFPEENMHVKFKE